MAEFANLSVKELRIIAKKAKVRGFSTMKREELIQQVQRIDDVPICFRVQHEGMVFGYCLPEHRPSILTALFAANWDLKQISKLGLSHREAIKKLQAKPIQDTVTKEPPQ